MTLMLVGLVLFFGVHFVPTLPALRARWAGAAGENGYKRGFSAIAAVGLALIVIGYVIAPRGGEIFAPSPTARSIAPLVMIASFILIAASHMKTHIRARLHHPMLLGIILWAAVHLLANGDTKGTVLFGSFLVYSVVDLASAINRRAMKPVVPAMKYDVMAVGGGVLLAAAVMLLHRLLFGVPAVSWSL